MAVMAAATRTMIFRTRDNHSIIRLGRNMAFDAIEETRPASAAVEFELGRE